MYVCEYELSTEDVDYLLDNEEELEEFLTSNLTVDEATELEIGLRGEQNEFKNQTLFLFMQFK